MSSSENAPTEDLTKFETLVSASKDQLREVHEVISKIRAKTDDVADMDASAGMSFLDLKNHMMLGYLQNLTLLMMKKYSGQSIQNDPAVLRVVEIRTVLEKMRPMESKLKYHIDKLLKSAVESAGDDSDPLKFRPNPDQLADAEQNEESDDEEVNDAEDQKGTRKQKKAGVYIPPRLAAVPYALDEAPKDRLQKQTDRAKKRALHSSIMDEIRREHFDEPEEIHDRDIYRLKADKRAREREQYEESNMVRLNVSRKEKARSKKMTTMGSLGQLAEFGDFRAVTGGDGDDREFGEAKSKKRKKAPKGKGKKGKKFKRKH